MVKSIFQKFLTHFTYSSIDKIEEYFDENTTIEYSTLGKHTGLAAILKAMQINDDFDIRSTVVSNLRELHCGNKVMLLANVCHLLAYESKNELFPLLFGGKYEFVFDSDKDKIHSVKFDLEYELGNTYLAKSQWGWSLYAQTCNKRLISLNGLFKEENNALDKEKIEQNIYKLLWEMDTVNYSEAEAAVSDNFYLCIYGYDAKKEMSSKSQLKKFIDNNKEDNDQNHYSIRINDIKIDTDKAVVRAQRFNPNKTGFKHLDSMTKYKLFFNEVVEFEVIKQEKTWRISKMILKPAVDVSIVGYDLIEI